MASTPSTQHRNPDLEAQRRALLQSYWRSNITLMLILLAIWATVGLGCGVLFADVLNQYHIGGFPLGFWFAQQGSIVCFVLLILVYAAIMNRLDRKHHDQLEALRRQADQEAEGD